MKKYLHSFTKYLFLKKHIIVSIAVVCALLLWLYPQKQQIGIVDMTKVYQNAIVFRTIHEQQQAFENSWKE